MSNPLLLSELYDRLSIASAPFDIQRNDEFSGTGDGDLWQAELARPLWTVEVTLNEGLHDELKQIGALIRALDGARQAFMMCDPLSLYPQADPGGLILGSAVVTLGAIGADRRVLPLQGLPAGYVLNVGDKVQIQGTTKSAFVEVSRTILAEANGTAIVPVFPRFPNWVVSGSAAVLKKPACPMVIWPESHRPGSTQGVATDGAGFKAVQKS